MKKALKIVGKIFLGLLILIAVFLIIITIYNQIMLKKEDKLLDSYPGERVEVDGHKLNVYVEGEGEQTLVFLPPSADTSPVFTFKPLYTQLSDEYRCAVVERFGYGMSDVIDDDRDFETIVKQDREALQKSGVEAPYILCPYSMSGIEALTWAQLYPDDVAGIVGIDMAFPESYDDTNTDISGEVRLISAVKATGLIRLFVGDDKFPDTDSPEDIKLERALVCRNFLNKCHVSEAENIKASVKRITDGEKPDVPMYLYLTNGEGTGSSEEEWQGFAKSYTEGMADVRSESFDCGHSEIITKNHEQLIKGIREFAEGLGK